MTETFSATLLASVSDFVSNQMGLYFPLNRLTDLERGLRAVAAAFDFKDPERCAEWLLSSPQLTTNQIEILASQLTVGETYFFREKQTFQALEAHVLPELLRSREADRRLRIWSAGCATGEEPYSLAILLARTIPHFSDWNISILGTDINPRALNRAAAGIYGQWSFRDCPAGIAERYFRRISDRQVEIIPEIKGIVDFSYLNLVEDRYPSLLNGTNAFDIIFCRNVLMYFSTEQARRVIDRLYNCLVEGGWLVVSSTEASHVLFSQFTTVNFPGAILYRRDRQPGAISSPPVFPNLEESAPLDLTLSEFQSLGRNQFELYPAPPALPVADAALEPPVSQDFGQVVAHDEAGRSDKASDSTEVPPPTGTADARGMADTARALANRGMLARALETCDAAIALDKLQPAFHYLRATILQEQGDAAEALNSLKRAIYIDHRFVLAHFALGNVQRSLGKRQESNRQFQNALFLLNEHAHDEVLPESEGITAGRLKEIIGKLTMTE